MPNTFYKKPGENQGLCPSFANASNKKTDWDSLCEESVVEDEESDGTMNAHRMDKDPNYNPSVSMKSMKM